MIRKNITVEKAKKILKEKGGALSDKQIENIINTLYLLCDQTVNQMTNVEK